MQQLIVHGFNFRNWNPLCLKNIDIRNMNVTGKFGGMKNKMQRPNTLATKDFQEV